MTDDDVDIVEAQLGIALPAEYRVFITNLPGAFVKAYGGYELFTDPQAVINETQGKRLGELIEVRFPSDYVVIGAPGNGDFFCLDLGREPPAVVEFDHERAKFKTIEFSFEAWVRRLSRRLDEVK
jgi:hypothetical protein